jgi:hypothetical protein
MDRRGGHAGAARASAMACFSACLRLALADEIEDRRHLGRKPQRDAGARRLPFQLARAPPVSTPCNACQIAGSFGLPFNAARKAASAPPYRPAAKDAPHLEQHLGLPRCDAAGSGRKGQRRLALARLLQAERVLVEPGNVRGRKRRHHVTPTG